MTQDYLLAGFVICKRGVGNPEMDLQRTDYSALGIGHTDPLNYDSPGRFLYVVQRFGWFWNRFL